MANGVDRGSVRYAINGYKSKHKRWEGVDDQFKADCVRALKVALRLSLERGDPRAIRGCVETAKSIEGQNQADDHLMVKATVGEKNESTITIKYANRLTTAED